MIPGHTKLIPENSDRSKIAFSIALFLGALLKNYKWWLEALLVERGRGWRLTRCDWWALFTSCRRSNYWLPFVTLASPQRATMESAIERERFLCGTSFSLLIWDTLLVPAERVRVSVYIGRREGETDTRNIYRVNKIFHCRYVLLSGHERDANYRRNKSSYVRVWNYSTGSL